MLWLSSSSIRKVTEFSTGVPFTYIEVPMSGYCRDCSSGEILRVLLYFLNSKVEDWPLTSLCEWNWRLCMRTVVVRTRNCKILTGANIYMVSYPFLSYPFNSFLFLLFVLVQFFFLARAFACLPFLNLPVRDRMNLHRTAANQIIARFYRN